MSKPFDLEAAKSGAPVMTRDGRPARIICYDRKTWSDTRVDLVALTMDDRGQETVSVYHSDGSSPLGEPFGLVMAPTTQRLFVNVYRSNPLTVFGRLFKQEEDARRQAKDNPALSGYPCVAIAVPIEWQE